MILNLYLHYIEDFFLWLFHIMQLFCQEDSSSWWFYSVCLSTLFFEFYFLYNDIFVFSVYCLYSVQLWVCWFLLRFFKLYSYKAVLQTCYCWRKINLTFCQNHSFTKDSESITELCQAKDLVSCWRACW